MVVYGALGKGGDAEETDALRRRLRRTAKPGQPGSVPGPVRREEGPTEPRRRLDRSQLPGGVPDLQHRPRKNRHAARRHADRDQRLQGRRQVHRRALERVRVRQLRDDSGGRASWPRFDEPRSLGAAALSTEAASRGSATSGESRRWPAPLAGSTLAARAPRPLRPPGRAALLDLRLRQARPGERGPVAPDHSDARRPPPASDRLRGAVAETAERAGDGGLDRRAGSRRRSSTARPSRWAWTRTTRSCAGEWRRRCNSWRRTSRPRTSPRARSSRPGSRRTRRCSSCRRA